MDRNWKVIIIGSGPAAYTAAIYTARAGLAPLVMMGDESGGQLMLTTVVENFPGFPEGVLGPDLMELMKKQAARFGSELLYEQALSVDFLVRPFKIMTRSGVYKAEAVIIATGASTKWLGLESEKRLIGHGISSCVICDGFFFKGKEVAVVGGGDTAIEEALFLTRFVERITVVHRRDQLRASKILQQRAFSNTKIGFRWNSIVDEILGKSTVEGIRLRDVNTSEVSELKVQGVFVAIGHQPNTEIFRGQIELDEKGYVVLKGSSKTSRTGIFAAGDVHDHIYKQAITAAGLGCMAALEIERYLESKDN